MITLHEKRFIFHLQISWEMYFCYSLSWCSRLIIDQRFIRYPLLSATTFPCFQPKKRKIFLSQLSMSIYFLLIEFFVNSPLSLSIESIMRCLYSFSRFSLIYLYSVSFLEIFSFFSFLFRHSTIKIRSFCLFWL